MMSVKSTFLPGSEWLYFKVYAGSNIIEKILVHSVYPCIQELKRKELIEKWFFIRYADPHEHLRIRFFVPKGECIGKVILLMYKRLNPRVSENSIWKIQIDTYFRELERYYPSLIENTESLFYIDSEYIISVLKMIMTNNDPNLRWMFALNSVDRILNAFSYSILQKKDLIAMCSELLKKEFGFNAFNSKQFNSKFRENRLLINSAMNNDFCISEIKRGSKIWSSDLNRVSQDILKKLNRNIDKDQLLSSYIHMTMNRFFMNHNRRYELLLYDFMCRYYMSILAQEKYLK